MISLQEKYRAFQTEKGAVHVYTGPKNKPHSILVIFDKNSIKPPIRVPSTSLETLEQRYSKQKLEIDNFQLPQKLLFSVLLQKKKIYHSLLNSSKIHELININEDFEDIAYSPMLKKYLSSQNSKTIEDQLSKVEQILTDPRQYKRQEALSELILQRSPTTLSLITWLLDIRSEVTAAILRECCRQDWKVPYLVKRCREEYLNSPKKGIERFAYLYLTNYNYDVVEEHRITMDLQYAASEITSLTAPQLQRKLSQQLSDERKVAAEAFKGLINLAKIDSSKLIPIIDIILQLPIPDTINYRVAIMHLIKFAEALRLPNLLGICMALSLQGRWISIEGNKPTFHIGDYGIEFRYIHRRTGKQLILWNEIDPKLVEESILAMLQYYPDNPIQIDAGNEINNETLFFKWINAHPIMNEEMGIIQLLKSNPNAFLKVYIHSLSITAPVLRNVLRSEFQKEEIVINTEKLSLFELYLLFIDNKELVEDTTIAKDQFSPHIIPQDNTMVEGLLDFCSSFSIYLDLESIEKIISYYITSSIERLSVLQRYLQSLDKEDITSTLSQIIDILTKEIRNSTDYEPYTQIVQDILISGPHIGNLIERTQYKIDAIKIIMKEFLSDFDLENFQPLAVETIVQSYELANGEIPKFIEGSINYAFSKPDWEQLARHYLAMGLKRPNAKALGNSQLKKIPSYLTRDILGQIAIVNQTISYCSRNGFTKPLENLIINNMYRRGWNVERRLEQTIATYLGNVSPRLRAYICAYLVIEQGEVEEDILFHARDVEDYQLRDKLIRTLERYGTTSMWITLAESYHPDMKKRALEQLKETRFSAEERSSTILRLLQSSREHLRELGKKWLKEYGIAKDALFGLLHIDYEDCWKAIFEYIVSHRVDYKNEYDHDLKELLIKILWTPYISRSLQNQVNEMISLISSPSVLTELKQELKTLVKVSTSSRQTNAIFSLNLLEEKI